MASILEELIEEHVALIGTYSAIRDMVTTSADASALLFRARQLLTSHLEREDSEVYPVIARCAKDDPQLQELLDECKRDMADATRAATYFFETYEKPEDSTVFKSQAAQLSEIILRRIEYEEKILFPAFARHLAG